MQFDEILFNVGDTVIRFRTVIVLVGGIVGVYFLSRWIVRPLISRLLQRTALATSSQYSLSKLVQYLLITIGVLIAFSTAGFNVSNLGFAIGFLSVGIGFGLQNITSNFVAGIILIFEHPVRVGDWITVSGVEGSVEEINIRSTKIRSNANIFVYVPNSEFVSGNLLNWTNPDPLVRVSVDFEVSQGTDLDETEGVLLAVARAHSLVLADPAPEMRLVGLGDSSWKIQLLVWLLEPSKHKKIESELSRSIVKAFDVNRIETGTPVREIRIVDRDSSDQL